MRRALSSMFVSVVLATLMSQSLLRAGSVRISFLNHSNVLVNTIGILTNNGCTEEGCSIFRRAVEHYYASGLDLDLGRFPKEQGGFYSFPTITRLIAAMPNDVRHTRHAWDINCFDTVIALADPELSIDLHPDDDYGPFMVSKMMTNGQEVVVFTATAGDAFFQMYAPWYVDSTDGLFPDSMEDARICLTAALFRWELLPGSTSETNLNAAALLALRSDWRRERLEFPKRFKVVLLYNADLKSRTICALHAGLLFHHQSGYTYLEKAGGSGPFIRLDFGDRDDLLPWLSAFDKRKHQYGHLLATFNDAKIETVYSR